MDESETGSANLWSEPLLYDRYGVHLRPPSIDHGVTSFLWGVVLGLFLWLLLRATGISQATSAILSALAAFGIFLYVRVYGEERPPRQRGKPPDRMR